MKLFKHFITDDDTVPPDPELIDEGKSVEDLKQLAMQDAKSITNELEEGMWLFFDNDASYHELTVGNTIRFVIRD